MGLWCCSEDKHTLDKREIIQPYLVRIEIRVSRVVVQTGIVMVDPPAADNELVPVLAHGAFPLPGVAPYVTVDVLVDVARILEEELAFKYDRI